MALGATIYQLEVALSDVDRSVYETLELRLARHPSESLRYMLTRMLAYALSYEEGISFSKGGLSSAEEPPVRIDDPTGLFLAWIDVGAPSAERLHKASKLARRVALYTHVEPALLRREASSRAIHKVETIEVQRFEPAFLDAVEATIERRMALEITRTAGALYVVAGKTTIEGKIEPISLVE